MATEQFAIFQYEHDDAYRRSRQRVVFCMATAMAAALASLVFFPGGLLAFLVPGIAWLARQKRLYVGPRYLLCGDRILYYANVVRVSPNPRDGTLTLETNRGAPFVLERHRFATTARKPQKIAANKEAKFVKVSEKIVARVRRAAPKAVRWL